MRIKREREAPSCAVFISGALKAVRERERANGCKLHATKNNRLTPVRRFSRAANFSCISLPSFPPLLNHTNDSDDNDEEVNDANERHGGCLPSAIIEFS